MRDYFFTFYWGVLTRETSPWILWKITAGRRQHIRPTRGVADPSSKVTDKLPVFSLINQSVDTAAARFRHEMQILPKRRR